jgi:hypothetical protein
MHSTMHGLYIIKMDSFCMHSTKHGLYNIRITNAPRSLKPLRGSICVLKTRIKQYDLYLPHVK